MKTIETPQAAVLDTFVDGKPFTISGDYETVLEQKDRADAYLADMQAAEAPVTVEKAPRTAPKPEMVQVTDLSLLEPREVLRRKISAAAYDLTHRTNMLGMFNEKLADDRNVAMAKRLGIITADRCAKHEKTVRMLKHLSLTD